MYTNFKIWE